MSRFRPLKSPAMWRRITLSVWETPAYPVVYHPFMIDFSRCISLLNKVNETSPIKLTPAHMVAKAAALTIRKFPDINGIIRRRKIYLRDQVDIYFNIAMPPLEKGEKPDLYGAKIENCDKRNIKDIAQELKIKAEKIRAKQDPEWLRYRRFDKFLPQWLLPAVLKLYSYLVHDFPYLANIMGFPPDPYGSALIANLVPLKIPSCFVPFTPIMRNSLAIAIGEIRDRPWVDNGRLVVRPLLDLTVTYDHRFMDEYTASEMGKYFTELIENPEKLIE